MTHMPAPVPMPRLAVVVRGAMEECQNLFDAGFPDREDGSKPLSYIELVPVGDGKLAEITCRRNARTGALTVSIRPSKIGASWK